MPETCTNTTWLDGHVSSVREVSHAAWMEGADIKSKNWQSKGGYRSKYDCSGSK